MYIALALALLAVALLAAKPVLRRDRVLETPPTELDSSSVEWGAIGVRVFSWIAGAGLVLAAVVLFGADAAWLPPAVRVALGFAAGIALLIVSERRIAPRYRFTSEALAGAAIGILYATFYAVLAAWQLPSLPIVIVGMLLVSAVAVVLAARRDSILVALAGLIGGFAMPAMPAIPGSLPSIEHPVLLFSYLLLLDAGMAWIAIRKRWLLLMVLSVVFTAIFQWAWVLQFLTRSQLPLAATIFAALAIVGTSPLWYVRRDECPEGFQWTAAAAAHLPLLFALYLAVIPSYGERYSILFGFLLIVDAGLLAIAWRGGPRWLRAAGGVATLLVFFLWLRTSYTEQVHASWPWPLLWLALFVALYLAEIGAAPFAALLFFVFIGLARQEPHPEAALVPVMLALLAAVLAVTMRRGRGQPIPAAIAIALSAVALMTLHPPLWLLLAIHALLLIALFAVAWISEQHLLAVLAIPFYVAMVITASYAPDWAYSPAVTLLAIAFVPFVLFVAYPLALGARARPALAPYVAAVLGGLVFFAAGWTVRHDVADAHRWLIGLVPLAVALAMLVLLWRLRTLEPREPREPRAPGEPGEPGRPGEPRFTLVASAALAFFNASVVMLLPQQWAVVLWALEVVALVWLFTRFKHRVLRAWSLLVAAAVFLRLAFDADLYVPWSVFATYTACGVAMIAAAYLARHAAPALQTALSVAGLFELWFLVNVAIANGYHAANGALSFDFTSTPHAADAAYTIAWAVIATGLLILGFLIDWAAARGAALALLLTTIFKCVVNDLPRLRGLALVASLLGLALSLVVVGVVLQKRLSADAVDVPASA